MEEDLPAKLKQALVLFKWTVSTDKDTWYASSTSKPMFMISDTTDTPEDSWEEFAKAAGIEDWEYE